MAATTENYASILRGLTVWDLYLLSESRLPGPRANLELAWAVADEGDTARFLHLIEYDPTRAPTGTPDEFLAVCGTIGLGQCIARGETNLWPILRAQASDPRWRVREGVAMALQRVGDGDIASLLSVAHEWASGNLLERRAAAAGVCEPRLLRAPEIASQVLGLLDEITESLAHEADRRTEPFRVLRQALGYCWSVAIAAGASEGKRRFEKLAGEDDPDVRWVVRENLKKRRLRTLDPEWVARLEVQVKR